MRIKRRSRSGRLSVISQIPTLPIIALSANAFKEDIDRSLAAGMNAHAVKPIDMKVLCATIQGLLYP